MPLILLICEMKTFFWKQKSCLKWLSDSDANTANFHAHYQNKRIHLHISKIKDSSNAILDSQENIKNEAVHFLTHLFCDDRSSNGDPFPLFWITYFIWFLLLIMRSWISYPLCRKSRELFFFLLGVIALQSLMAFLGLSLIIVRTSLVLTFFRLFVISGLVFYCPSPLLAPLPS